MNIKTLKGNKNICLISHSAGKGGAELSLLLLIDALKDLGCRCHVILPSSGPLVKEIEKREIDWSIIPYNIWMRPSITYANTIKSIFVNILASFLVSWQIIKWKCDIIISNSLVVCVGGLANIFLKRSHFWFIHEFGKEDHGMDFKFGQRFSFWLLDKMSSLVIVNSKAVKEKYLKIITPIKLKVLYYYRNIDFLPKSKSSSKDSSKITCICMGNLFPGKGQEDAIKAVNKLVKEKVPIELILVGYGKKDYRDYLQRMVAREELTDFVTFIGWMDNPFPVLEKSDIFLMCSRSEAFGYVTLEAMLFHKPIIGARSGGTVELVQEGFNGLLYTPGDYLELASKIKYLYNNQQVIQEYGKNGYLWAKNNFNYNIFKQNLHNILKSYLNN